MLKRYGRDTLTKLDTSKIAYLIKAHEDRHETCSNIAIHFGVSRRRIEQILSQQRKSEGRVPYSEILEGIALRLQRKRFLSFSNLMAHTGQMRSTLRKLSKEMARFTSTTIESMGPSHELARRKIKEEMGQEKLGDK